MNPVSERVVIGMAPEEVIEGIDEASDGVTVSGHPGVRREDEAGMASAIDRPCPTDGGEVSHVVGQQGAALGGADREESLVVLPFPSAFHRSDDVVAGASEAVGDDRRVVIVERQSQRSAC